MNHPAELALHQYMENAANGKSTNDAISYAATHLYIDSRTHTI